MKKKPRHTAEPTPATASQEEWIKVRGARVNNLRNVDVDIPRDKLTVITGVSGSGKSSLAFDTLYAEGQRRYVESLSTYARQFLGRLAKPDCDKIEGIPPAIAIEQKVTSRNPRSTVGTSTEIYEYLRMLYARIGKTISPVSGQEVKKHSIGDVVSAMTARAAGTRMMVLAPIVVPEGRSLQQQLSVYQKEGYARVYAKDSLLPIEEALTARGLTAEDLYLVVDRMTAGTDKDTIDRLMESSRTALFEGRERMTLAFIYRDAEAATTRTELQAFSTAFEADGIKFEEPTDGLFSFNSPAGACPKCEGFGQIIGVDEDLVIPDKSLSVQEGAVMCWRGEKMSEWKKEFVRRAARHDFPVFTPYYDLTDSQRDLLWHGIEGEDLHDSVCIDAFFEMLRLNQYKIQYRVMLARYRGRATCPVCHGGRLRQEANYVKIGGRGITELVRMSVQDLRKWFDHLALSDRDSRIASRLLTEIKNRLKVLDEVGLGYLTLDRLSKSLSGGESQRISLARSLGSSLVGSIYILDEPSIGLHSRDTDRLIHVLKELRDLGNTVVVVEHDEEMMRAADYLIDIGPDAGRLGGQVVYQGPVPDTSTLPQDDTATGKTQAADTSQGSHTLDYLTGREQIAVPQSRRPWTSYLEVKGARENNLKGIDVKFPLHVLTVVTGVSGSGKSTLVCNILYRALKRTLDEPADRPGQYAKLLGDTGEVKHVEFVNQNPLGTSSRSNPVTYIGAYDEIRHLMALQPLAKQMNYTPAFFSFNQPGGRCEECKGEGVVTIEMQFMNDLTLTCESCHGKRFKKDILDVRYEGKNIFDILEMTVNEATEFFAQHNQPQIVSKLQPLRDVGLGYLKMGQNSSSLSGGENQRVKLAYYLSMESQSPTLFIFDEPTTGLHFHDIRRLLDAFNALIQKGHSVLVIEHNMEIIKCADHVIDLGPEGGAAGGNVVVCGTPEEVAQCATSYTGQFLKPKLPATAAQA